MFFPPHFTTFKKNRLVLLTRGTSSGKVLFGGMASLTISVPFKVDKLIAVRGHVYAMCGHGHPGTHAVGLNTCPPSCLFSREHREGFLEKNASLAYTASLTPQHLHRITDTTTLTQHNTYTAHTHHATVYTNIHHPHTPCDSLHLRKSHTLRHSICLAPT